MVCCSSRRFPVFKGGKVFRRRWRRRCSARTIKALATLCNLNVILCKVPGPRSNLFFIVIRLLSDELPVTAALLITATHAGRGRGCIYLLATFVIISISFINNNTPVSHQLTRGLYINSAIVATGIPEIFIYFLYCSIYRTGIPISTQLASELRRGAFVGWIWGWVDVLFFVIPHENSFIDAVVNLQAAVGFGQNSIRPLKTEENTWKSASFTKV